MTITLTKEESKKLFYDALCNGLSCIASYGIRLEYTREDYKESKDRLNLPCYEDILLQILVDGKTLKVVDLEEGVTIDLTLAMVEERVQNTPPRDLLDMFNEEGDGGTADILLQTVFFNDVIYG